MDFIGEILGALGSFGAAIEQALIYIFTLLVQIAQFIWDVLQSVAQFLLSVLGKIGEIFKQIWNGFLKGIFVPLFHAIQKAHAWLESHLRPIINFLKQAQAYIDKLYKTYVRPVLVLIQHVRQVLSILRLLHLKFAAQLDAVLQTVQGDINRVFLTIRGTLNSVIDLLNIIADPERLVRKPILILSLRRTVHALVRQVTGLPPAFFFPSGAPGAPVGIGKLGKHFDPSDPAQNPPASYYLGLDYGVPSLDFVDPEIGPPDNVVDDMGTLGFFDNTLYSSGPCVDVEQCIQDAAQSGMVGDPYAIS